MSTFHSHPEIFVSYARNDGEEITRLIRRRLMEDHGFRLWQDRSEMEGGKDWWQQIVEALKFVKYMLLVMTPAALDSEVIRKEWRLARQEGVYVIPVLGVENLKTSSLPKWMQQTHLVSPDIPEQWERLVTTLKNTPPQTRVPFMVGELPTDFVPRQPELDQIVESLLDQTSGEPLAITTALQGAGGYGKTTLAIALCHDERIQEAFHDGILWVSLGQKPDVSGALTKLYIALTGKRLAFIDSEDASNNLEEELGERDCLLVIDDVWNEAHVHPFLRGGQNCARLITTRNVNSLPAKTKKRVFVDAMRSDEATKLLASNLPVGEEILLRNLAARLGEWPVLLKLVNGALRDRVLNLNQRLPNALRFVDKALDKKGFTAFDAREAIDRNQAVAITLSTSFDLLTENELIRYSELGIFPEDVEIPLRIVARFWEETGGLDEFDMEELCVRFSQLSLFQDFDLTARTIRLHDVVRNYLRDKQRNNLASLHNKFLVALLGESSLIPAAEDPYLSHYLAYHLMGADRETDLKKLLLNFEWIQTKLECTDSFSLLSDFNFLPVNEEIQLVKAAIRFSAPVLVNDPLQLPAQLLGRLLSFNDLVGIQKLLHSAKARMEGPLFYPKTGSLTNPGGLLISAVQGHMGSINSVRILTKRKRLLSVSNDGTLKIWDLEMGVETQTLVGHRNSVKSLAVTPDELFAVTGGDDNAVMIWDLDSGERIRVLEGHTGTVRSISVTPDGKKAISASDDGTLKVWDIHDGSEISTLTGHEGAVTAVIATPDGKSLISGSADGTLKVWNSLNSREEATLCGHSAWIWALGITPDGQRIFSGSDDRTIKIWNFTSKTLEHTFVGHLGEVYALAVTPDGQRLVSSATDNLIKVWNISLKVEEETLPKHQRSVTALTISQDGQQLISGADDGTLRWWNLSKKTTKENPLPHDDYVGRLAVTPEGRFAISTSGDGFIKIWDIISGNYEGTLGFHSSPISSFAITPDSCFVISGSNDRHLRIWGLRSGVEERSLYPHLGLITALAVTLDGKHVVSISEFGTLRLWDYLRGNLLKSISLPEQIVSDIALTPDGARMIMACGDGKLTIFDLPHCTKKSEFSAAAGSIHSVAVTPDSQKVVSASGDGKIEVWDIDKGVLCMSLQGHKDAVNDLAIPSSNGRWLASVADDGSVRLWDLNTGQEVATFNGDDSLLSCTIAPQGDTVVAGEASGQIHFLSVQGLN